MQIALNRFRMTWFKLVIRACIWYSQFNILFGYNIYYNRPDNSVSGHNTRTIIYTAYLRNAYLCSSDVRKRTDGWELLFDEAKHYIIERTQRFQGLNDDRTKVVRIIFRSPERHFSHRNALAYYFGWRKIVRVTIIYLNYRRAAWGVKGEAGGLVTGNALKQT